MKVGMIGCGKLGLACAEVMAQKHFVEGYDIAPKIPENFEMVNSIEELVKDKELIFIAIQTPHDSEYGGDKPTAHLENKDFDYKYVKDVLKEVNKYATKDQLVVLISTTLPGTVRREFIPLCENFRFVYNPYLIAMGSVKWDMVNPEMIIIGTEDGYKTGDAMTLINFYNSFMANTPRYVVGTWDEAEAIKIFYNTFISAKLSIVNMIQEVAERNGNMNVDIVTDALRDSTQRIMGPRYMRAGMGDGGPCHPRDNIALRHMAENLDLGYDLFNAIMESREKQAENLARFVTECGPGKEVVILGKAYKPGVEFTDGSYSLLVGHYIDQVEYYDPNTGDYYWPTDPAVFLIGYWDKWTYDIISKMPDNSIIVDPWRKISRANKRVRIFHYGNTRDQS